MVLVRYKLSVRNLLLSILDLSGNISCCSEKNVLSMLHGFNIQTSDSDFPMVSVV